MWNYICPFALRFEIQLCLYVSINIYMYVYVCVNTHVCASSVVHLVRHDSTDHSFILSQHPVG